MAMMPSGWTSPASARSPSGPASSLPRGDRCYREGTIRLNEWTDREGLSRHGLQVAAHYIDKHAPRAHKPTPKGNPAARDVARPLDTDSRPAQRREPFNDAIPF